MPLLLYVFVIVVQTMCNKKKLDHWRRLLYVFGNKKALDFKLGSDRRGLELTALTGHTTRSLAKQRVAMKKL
jgi:hypothetical protein